jgi:hypothetical protein
MDLPQGNAKDQVVHPVQVLQSTGRQADEAQELHRRAVTQGWAFATSTTLQRKHLAGTRRMAGLNSSNLMLDSFNNKLTRVEFSDFLGLPDDDANVQPRPRAVVEAEYFGEELVQKAM